MMAVSRGEVTSPNVAAGTAKKSRRRNVDGRLALILAAEREFARNGIDAMPLRGINTVAGFRNASAAHYHFGSRDGLLKAVLDHRMPAVSACRRERLNLLLAAPDAQSLSALLATWVMPLAEQLGPKEGGSYYLRFLERLRREARPRYTEWVAGIAEEYPDLLRAIRLQLNELPHEVVRSRLAIVADQLISSLATLEHTVEEAGDRRPGAVDFAVSNLIDFVAGGLTAPVSARTEALLADAEQGVNFRFRLVSAFDESFDPPKLRD